MKYLRIQTSDETLNRIQDSIASVVQDLNSQLFPGGNLVKFDLKTGKDNLVPHGLAKMPQVWIVARLDTNATIWEQVSADLSGQSATKDYLNLRCSADCSISVWVNG